MAGRNEGKAPRRRRSQQGPTVADVAKLAGVSAMTVSRVVNGDAHVLDETRQRVREAVQALGYVPNQAARSLAGGRQSRIALLHSNPSAAYLSEFLVGALDEAGPSNAQLVVERCSEGEPFAELAARLVRNRIDACLLPPPLCDEPGLLDELAHRGLAMAQVATGVPSPLAHAVSIDDEAAAHAMTARLIAQGHRRIALVAGDANQTASGLRRRGYERALAEAGLAIDPELIEQGDFTYRSGLAAADRLLALGHRPTAIFACNDDMAAACMAIAHQRGLSVPGDLSICGFDDTAMATTVWPELTTIRQPIAEMARRAVRLLVAGRDRSGSATCHDRLDFELVPRASDGKAP